MSGHMTELPFAGWRRTAVMAALAAGMLAPAGHAFAASAIGGAEVVKNTVRSQPEGKDQFKRVRVGDQVFLNDLVRTAVDSMTKIVFRDTTNMSVGPDSSVKLDRFVYNGDGTAKEVVIHATKGAFRFFSGKSESKAYKVTTPQAVIGVRGTTYDVRITNGLTLVVLQEGEVNVCVTASSNCRTLNQPGQSVVVNDTGITGPIPPANKPWDFASLCSGSSDRMCSKTTRFAFAPPPPPPSAAPKVRPKKAAKPKKASRPKRTRRPPRKVTRLPPPRRPRPRPEGGWVSEPPPPPQYDGPPVVVYPRPGVRPPRPCRYGDRRPWCRPVVRPPRPPKPCRYGRRSRGCGPVVRPPKPPRPCIRGRGHGCKPVVRPRPRPPKHGRPIYRPRPPKHGRPIFRPRPPKHGRPVYRPRPRPIFGRPKTHRPRLERPRVNRGRTFGRSSGRSTGRSQNRRRNPFLR